MVCFLEGRKASGYSVWEVKGASLLRKEKGEEKSPF